MAGMERNWAASASPSNGTVARARTARSVKRREMVIGNPPVDVPAASFGRPQPDGTQLPTVTESRRRRQIGSGRSPNRWRPDQSLHLPACAPARSSSFLRRAFAAVAVGYCRLRVGGGDAATVKQNRNLVAGSEFAIGPAPFVDQAKDIPFVVRAAADGRRRAQRVVFAEHRLGEPVLHSLLEIRVELDPL